MHETWSCTPTSTSIPSGREKPPRPRLPFPNISSGRFLTLSKSYLWATPALTDVVDRVVSVTTDLVSRYDVDGIHLDLVRYPGPDTSYDPFSNTGYESALAGDPDLTRADQGQDLQSSLLQLP